MTFRSFPIIKTKRLLLRQIEELDADVILFLRSDPTVTKFIERPENRKIKNKIDALNFIKKINKEFENHKSISWGITLINDSKIIGTICLWNFSDNNKTGEVGYDLHPEFLKMGFMSEALNSVIDFGFHELKLNKIEAYTHMENENSKKLLENNGFIFNRKRKDEENKFNSIYELLNAGD